MPTDCTGGCQVDGMYSRGLVIAWIPYKMTNGNRRRNEWALQQSNSEFAELPSLRVFRTQRGAEHITKFSRKMQVVNPLQPTVTNTDKFYTYRINPSVLGAPYLNPNAGGVTERVTNTFQAVDEIARNFERYRFKHLMFHYVPRVGTFTAGVVRFGYSDDPTVNDVGSIAELSLYSDTTSTQVADCLTIDIACDDKWLWTRSGQANLRLTDFGKFVVGINSQINNAINGEIYVSYELEFKDYISETLNNDNVNNSMTMLTSIGQSTLTAPFLPLGDTPTLEDNGLELTMEGSVLPLNADGVRVNNAGLYCLSYTGTVENNAGIAPRIRAVVDGVDQPGGKQFSGTTWFNGTSFGFSCILNLAQNALVQVGSSILGYTISNPEFLLELVPAIGI